MAAAIIYIVARALSIQSHAFKTGDVVGTGDVDHDTFTPAEGLEDFVTLGHVKARLADGRITRKGKSVAKNVTENVTQNVTPLGSDSQVKDDPPVDVEPELAVEPPPKTEKPKRQRKKAKGK